MHNRRSTQYATSKNLIPTEILETIEVINIRSYVDKQKLIENNHVLCVYLWGDSCEPCKLIAPKYAELSKQYNNKCLLVKENIKLNITKDSISEYKITAIPAFLFYKNGNIVKDSNGKIVDVIGGDFNKVKTILNNLLN